MSKNLGKTHTSTACSEWLILCIGGPLSGQWVDHMGIEFVSAEHDVPSQRYELFNVNGSDNSREYIYVAEGLTPEEAVKMLLQAYAELLDIRGSQRNDQNALRD